MLIFIQRLHIWHCLKNHYIFSLSALFEYLYVLFILGYFCWFSYSRYNPCIHNIFYTFDGILLYCTHTTAFYGEVFNTKSQNCASVAMTRLEVVEMLNDPEIFQQLKVY